MPNRADNTLEIRGPKKEVQKFKDKLHIITVDEKDISPKLFSTFVPRPKSENDNSDDWNVGNWGTKWDVDGCIEIYEDKLIRFYFESAWCGPMKFISALSKKFPKLFILS